MPDFGDHVEAYDGDLPVFWACGMTPQAALRPYAVQMVVGIRPLLPDGAPWS